MPSCSEAPGQDGLAAKGIPMEEAIPEGRRTGPDFVVYLPRGGAAHDGDNEHFLVFESPSGEELLAMWTQSSVEGYGDNRTVLARSRDGITWSAPIQVAGTTPGTT